MSNNQNPLSANFPSINTSPITIDQNTGLATWTPTWYRYLINQFARTGGTYGNDPDGAEYSEMESVRGRPSITAPADIPSQDRKKIDWMPAFAELSDQVAMIKRNRLPQLITKSKTWAALTIIQIWGGSIATIPAGWQLCDGTNSTPNLEDLFVIGAGNNYAVGATGGSTTIGVTNLPSHTHVLTMDTHHHTDISGVTDTTVAVQAGTADTTVLATVTATAGNTGSTVATGTNANTGGGVAYLQPYYALAYIINTTPYTVLTSATLET